MSVVFEKIRLQELPLAPVRTRVRPSIIISFFLPTFVAWLFLPIQERTIKIRTVRVE